MNRLKHSEIKTERERLLAAQNGCCALCGHKFVVDNAVLDHDHGTGHTRAVIHSDCNVLLGKVENYSSRQGRKLQIEGRLGAALRYMWDYMTTDWTDNPWHPTHKTPEERQLASLKRKYTKLLKQSKRPATKAKYRQLLEELK